MITLQVSLRKCKYYPHPLGSVLSGKQKIIHFAEEVEKLEPCALVVGI